MKWTLPLMNKIRTRRRPKGARVPQMALYRGEFWRYIFEFSRYKF